jgi:hypothetical protein
VSKWLEDGADVYIRAGAPPAETTPLPEAVAAAPTAAEAPAVPTVLCRNFGCNTKYVEAENHATACRYHTKPPIFHEARKGWSCCSDRLVWDWDEFMKLEGCTVGMHSTVDPKVRFAPSPTVAAAASVEGDGAASSGSATATAAPAPAPRIRTVEDFNRANPDAVTAAASVGKLVASGPPKAAPRTDGRAVCVHNGCRKEYVVAGNGDAACSFHTGQAVFHDGGKHWSCCPKQVRFDFDEFLAVPGCAVGPHADA